MQKARRLCRDGPLRDGCDSAATISRATGFRRSTIHMDEKPPGGNRCKFEVSLRVCALEHGVRRIDTLAPGDDDHVLLLLRHARSAEDSRAVHRVGGGVGTVESVTREFFHQAEELVRFPLRHAVF